MSSQGRGGERLFLIDKCNVRGISRIRNRWHASYHNILGRVHTYANWMLVFSHPIPMTGDCHRLSTEPVHTSPLRLWSELHRGPVRLWLRFRPEFKQKVGSDLSLKRRTGTYRTPAVSHIRIKCEPSLKLFFPLQGLAV